MQTNYFIFRYKAVFSFFFMMLGLISCAKDLGNYDYKDVNEVKIEFEHESYSAVYKKDTLRIEPKIISTDPSMKMSDYEFEWLAVFTVDDVTKRIKIGSSLKLEYPVTLHPGSYSVHLKVKDKNTELQWRKDFSLSVRTEISRGFLLLGEDETGYANVDMIAMPKDTFVIKNLLTDNGLPKLKGPQRILYTGTYIDYLNPYVRLWIMTKDRSYYVSTRQFDLSTSRKFGFSNDFNIQFRLLREEVVGNQPRDKVGKKIVNTTMSGMLYLTDVFEHIIDGLYESSFP